MQEETTRLTKGVQKEAMLTARSELVGALSPVNHTKDYIRADAARRNKIDCPWTATTQDLQQVEARQTATGQKRDNGQKEDTETQQTGWQCDSEWVQDKTSNRHKWACHGAETRQLTTRGWKEDTETQQIGTRQADTVIVSGYETRLTTGINETACHGTETRVTTKGQKQDRLPGDKNKTRWRQRARRQTDQQKLGTASGLKQRLTADKKHHRLTADTISPDMYWFKRAVLA